MRSHPYAPAPPLPPLLDDIASDLAAILPNQTAHNPNVPRHRRASSASMPDLVELSALDPDTSRLLPTRQKRHHVRVQGKLVVVRTTNLKVGGATTGNTNGSGAGSGSAPASPGLPVGVSAPLVTPGGSGGGMFGGMAGDRPGPMIVGRGSPLRGRRRSLDDSGVEEDGTETEEEVREVAVRDRQLRGYGIGGAGNIRRATDVANFANPDKRRWNLREMLGLTALKTKTGEL